MCPNNMCPKNHFSIELTNGVKSTKKTLKQLHLNADNSSLQTKQRNTKI